MNGEDADSIYLDFAKAFDKVVHKLLLQKLHLYKIHPKLINWIQSFLADQTQVVLLDGHMSLLALIISGVPQGTVLGIILFLIFINNINKYVINVTICCFADDTRLLKSIASSVYVQLRQKDLNKVMVLYKQHDSSHGQV